MKQIDKSIIITAIIALCVMEVFALLNGINGTFRMIITAAICGLAGWVIPSPKVK